MSRVLVTGANGFLAVNTIIELLKRGYTVRGMLRNTARLAAGHENLTPFYGCITEEADVLEAVRGCEIVIHTAAATNQSFTSYRCYEKVNVAGTRNVIRASLKHKVKKVIYVSTANAFGYGTKTDPGDETRPMEHPYTGSGYAVSKARAQQMILKELKGSGTGITVVNPTFLIGPNDHKISSNRIIIRALGKRILFIPPGGKNFIHVNDAAKGICNAIEAGADGECYLLAGKNLTYREFYTLTGDLLKPKPFLITIPSSLLLIAGLGGTFARLAGINTALSITNMKILSVGNYYSAGKAVKFLRLPQTSIKTAIQDTITWLEKKTSFSNL